MTRQPIIFACAVIALIGSVVGVFATMQQRDYMLRGYVNPTQSADLPFRIDRRGVNVELTQYGEPELRQHLDWMVEAHVTWLRQEVRWDEIEPESSGYVWSNWDQIFRVLDDYPKLQLIAVLKNSPQWARQSGTKTAPPDDPNQFAKFAFDFASRYRVAAYQIWDEPNITIGWGNTEPRSSDYAALLQAASQAIRSADSEAMLLAAGLAPTTETGPDNLSDLIYLRQLYVLGADQYVDGFAAKPFGFDSSPLYRDVDSAILNFSRVVALREIMVEHNDGDRLLWISAWGWNSLPADWRGDESIWGQVTQADQIMYTRQAIDRAEREWPWLGGMVLHHWQPNVPQDDPQWGFSIISANGTPGPLWTMLVDYPPPDHPTNGLYPPRNTHATYSGTWIFSDFGADMGWTQDSRLTFSFSGQEIALLLREDDYTAYLYPTIDGQLPDALPYDANGNSYILLRSGTLQPSQRLVLLDSNLAAPSHTLLVVTDELIPDESINRWPLVGYAVSGGDLSQPYINQLMVAWMAVAMSTLAVAVSYYIWQPTGLKRYWLSISNAGQIILAWSSAICLMGGMMLTWGDGIPSLFRREPVQIGLSILTAGIIYINEYGIIPTLLAAVVLFVIIYQRLELGFMLTVFWVPFFLFPVELYHFAFPIAEIVFWITFAAWMLKLPTSIRPIHVNSLDILVMLWMLMSVVSLAWVDYRDIAITEVRSLFLQPTLFYLMLRTTPYSQRRLVDTLIVAGFVVAALGIVMWLLGDAIITAEQGTRRLAGVYGSPNNVGLFLGRCIPFALASALLSDQFRRHATIVALITMFVAVLLTQSAGALFIGVPAGIVTVLVLVYRRRAMILVAGLAALFLVGLLIASTSPRFDRLLSLDEGTNFYRIRVWQSAWSMISHHPVTGLGPDQFLNAYRGEYMLPDAWEEPELSHPHNILLDNWLRLGLPGLLIIGLTQLAFWRRWYGYHTKIPVIAIGVAGSMMNLLAHGLVDNSIYVLDLVYIYVLLLALVAANVRAIDDDTPMMV